jgi:acyl-coenzyme A synthetase/AMP-(fatty) acid ligase
MHFGVPYAERVRDTFVVEVFGLTSKTRYWNDQQQTRSAMRRHPGDEVNLWMHTGDKGIMDKDGYLRSE